MGQSGYGDGMANCDCDCYCDYDFDGNELSNTQRQGKWEKEYDMLPTYERGYCHCSKRTLERNEVINNYVKIS